MPRKAFAHLCPCVASVASWGPGWQPFWASTIPKCPNAVHHFLPSGRTFSPCTVRLPQMDIGHSAHFCHRYHCHRYHYPRAQA